VKAWIRNILIRLGWPLTRNIRYDILTERILRKCLTSGDTAVDVGAHKGEILDIILSCSPQQAHWAFEPIPWLYDSLRQRYTSLQVHPFALSKQSGETAFQIVRDDLAYSGIRQRNYRHASPHIETVQVQMRTLDDLIPPHQPIRLIKIDVEGGEYDVLLGAKRTISTHHPVLIFEFGKGASEHYEIGPNDMFDLLESLQYRVYTLSDFLREQIPLTRSAWCAHYDLGTEYYFVAAAANKTN